MKPIKELIAATGALQEGAHVIGSDGRHVLGYCEPALILGAEPAVLRAIGLHLVLPFYENGIGAVVGASTEMALLESAALGIEQLTCKRPLVVPLSRTNEGGFVCDVLIAGSNAVVISAATNSGSTSQAIAAAVKSAYSALAGAATVCYVGAESFPPLGATRSIALSRSRTSRSMAPQDCRACSDPNKPIVIELSDFSGDHLDCATPLGGFVTKGGIQVSRADLLRVKREIKVPELVSASA